MSDPLAYLLTWTCYGTWLHGDDRGSVDDEHRTPGAPFLPPDAIRNRAEIKQLRHPPVELKGPARQIVADTIRAHRERRNWDLLALNVRTNHVHAVLACGLHADGALRELKAWTTRRLREAGYVPREAPVWTHHGSTRYLWKQRSVNAAVEYVAEHQGHDLR
ncbi:MAG: hypothetical protein V1790_02330 [Planctomycetota bacterium]